MRYLYIFILTLILISCNEKKGYSDVEIIHAERIEVTSESECRNAIEKGKILLTYQNPEKQMLDVLNYTNKYWWGYLRILHKGYVYEVASFEDLHKCFEKRKFHDK